MGKSVIKRDRLAQSFVGLVKIDSVSKEEGALCRFLQSCLSRLGVETLVDDAGVAVGGDSGNLIGRYHGNRTVPLAYEQLTAPMGYVLDARNPEVIITRAPAVHGITL